MFRSIMTEKERVVSWPMAIMSSEAASDSKSSLSMQPSYKAFTKLDSKYISDSKIFAPLESGRKSNSKIDFALEISSLQNVVLKHFFVGRRKGP